MANWACDENAKFIRSARAAGGLVSGLMCFHTTFSCSAEFIQPGFRPRRRTGRAGSHALSEGVHEPEYALKHFGLRPIEYYDHLGVAGPSMLASQCVQFSRTRSS